MHHRLFTLPIFLALLPLLAAALWIQSYSKPITLGMHYFPNIHSAWDFYAFHSTEGLLIYEHIQDPYWTRADSPLRSRPRFVLSTKLIPAHGGWHVLRINRFSFADGGFDSEDQEHGSMNVLEFPIPYWLITLCTATCPAFLLARRLLKRRPHTIPTLCPNCSYDLRAHAPNSNCPECGTPIPQKEANSIEP